MARVTQLDFARGVAILAVLKFHFLALPTNNLLFKSFDSAGKQLGWLGVDLFFVLSGFLVGGLLVQELRKTGDIRVRRFLIRRALKIWPAYYVYLLFQVVTRHHPLRTFFWQNLLNIQNYAGTSLAHTWSLAIEEHFYLALPLFIWLCYRNQRLRRLFPAILVSLCLLVLAGRVLWVYGLDWGDPGWLTHARMDSLLFGVLLSWFFYTERARFDYLLGRRIALFSVFVLGIAFASTVDHHAPLMDSLGYTINYLSLAALLLLIYGYRGRLTGTLIYKWIAGIGVYSYGIYLWHLSVREPVVRIAGHLPQQLRWSGALCGQYVAAIVLGILTTLLIEFPMLRLRDRMFPRGPAAPPPARP